MNTKKHTRPTPLFLRYVAQLVLRSAVLAIAVILFVKDPALLDFATRFGPAHGFDFVDAVFVLLALDLISKLRPRAKIAMGSRKQYRDYLVPTRLGNLVRDTRQAARETAQGVAEAGKQLAYSMDVLRLLPWSEEELTKGELLRESIRRRRLREIVPVGVFWVMFNVAIGLILDRNDLLNQRTVLLWTLFYSVFDLFSVVLWCPLQLMLMRNRCCTTCQIFNWDGMMTVTPLLLVGCWFSWVLIVLAVAVLVRWELAFARHPERFDERTNAALQCANCKDKLCYLRKPLTPRRRATTV